MHIDSSPVKADQKQAIYANNVLLSDSLFLSNNLSDAFNVQNIKVEIGFGW